MPSLLLPENILIEYKSEIFINWLFSRTSFEKIFYLVILDFEKKSTKIPRIHIYKPCIQICWKLKILRNK